MRYSWGERKMIVSGFVCENYYIRQTFLRLNRCLNLPQRIKVKFDNK